MGTKLTPLQANQLLYVESRADFLKTAMRDSLPNAAYPVELIDRAVKEFKSRLTM